MDKNKEVGCCGKGSVESLVTKFKMFQTSRPKNNPFDFVGKFPQTLPQTTTPATPQLTANCALKFVRK
jgi:hypothetical protein